MPDTPIAATLPRERRTSPTPLAVGSVLVIVGSLGYVSLNDLPPREASLHPVGVVASTIAVVGCLMLCLSLVQVLTRVSRWAALASAAGVWTAGAFAWCQSTVIVAAASGTTNQTFDRLFFESPWVLGALAPKAVLCLVGFIGLAVAGWRRRSMPRPAVALLGLAAVLSIWPPYPPGLIVASLAFLVIARTQASGLGFDR